MKIVIVHHHFRPGGVRRVIELAAPHLARALGERLTEIVLAGGEAPDARWLTRFRAAVSPRTVTGCFEPAAGYATEHRLSPASRRRKLRRLLTAALGTASGDEAVVWAHNPSLARNPALTRELERLCAARSLPLILHHHDWWFDNRWARWREMQRQGVRTLAQAAELIFSTRPHVRHVAINRADAAILRRHLGARSGWIPNLADAGAPTGVAATRRARRWIAQQLGDDAPLWLVPCRVLRRKNLAEALLLARWLRPEAWLATTGGISSADERAYARRLTAAARRAGWRLRLGLLAGRTRDQPTVAELLAVSEAVLLTSTLEGFGLPYLEAAGAGRPLLVRALPNIAPDLAEFGFRYPQSYEELLVPTGLFDWNAERGRQSRLFRQWVRDLPRHGRALAGRPAVLDASEETRSVPFSRLTLTAQLEVLRQPLEISWRACAALNPFLRTWRRRAARRALRVTRWPPRASDWLSGRAYAKRFVALLNTRPPPLRDPAASRAAQEEFLEEKLRAANLYPLLWDSSP